MSPVPSISLPLHQDRTMCGHRLLPGATATAVWEPQNDDAVPHTTGCVKYLDR